MEYFWEHGPCSASEVYAHINRSVNSVGFTLQNLAEKGLLHQEKGERKADGHFYSPHVTKEDLMIHAIQMLLSDLKANPRERQRVFEALQ